TGGDEDLMTDLCHLFLDQCPLLVAELEAGIAQNNLTQVERTAHKLKGSVSLFGLKSATQAVIELELLAKNQNSDALNPALSDLREKLTTLSSQIQELAPESKASAAKA